VPRTELAAIPWDPFDRPAAGIASRAIVVVVAVALTPHQADALFLDERQHLVPVAKESLAPLHRRALIWRAYYRLEVLQGVLAGIMYPFRSHQRIVRNPHDAAGHRGRTTDQCLLFIITGLSPASAAASAATSLPPPLPTITKSNISFSEPTLSPDLLVQCALSRRQINGVAEMPALCSRTPVRGSPRVMLTEQSRPDHVGGFESLVFLGIDPEEGDENLVVVLPKSRGGSPVEPLGAGAEADRVRVVELIAGNGVCDRLEEPPRLQLCNVLHLGRCQHLRDGDPLGP
jgi:hypothetical protein